MAVVRVLRSVRVGSGLTLRQLARRTRVDHAAISRAERGLALLSRPAMLRLAAFFSRDADALLAPTNVIGAQR